MPQYNPWADPIFPQGAAFGTGSPAETDQQPSGMSNVLSGLYNALGDVAKRAIGNSANALTTGTYNPAPVVDAAMLPMGTGAIAGVPMRAGEAVLGAGPIRAYHGSPHDFDAFDLSKIGTGEGAQAYGHGLYFADSENVAKSYRDALQQWKVDGAVPNPSDPAHIAAVTLKSYNGDAAKALADLSGTVGSQLPQGEREAAARAAELIRSGSKLPQASGGHMYEVNINADPAHFLDWDKPLPREWLEKHMADFPDVLAGDAKQRAFLGADKGYSGRAAYAKAADWQTAAQLSPANAAETTKKLAEAGIPGIKYLDQGSRGAGQGSSNYVVFNDRLIDIIKKYGLAGMLGAPIFANNGQKQ